jgi:putative heme transporter
MAMEYNGSAAWRPRDDHEVRPFSRNAIQLLVVALLSVGALYLVYRLAMVVAAMLLAFAEVALLQPLVARLHRRRVPRVVAALLVIVGFAALFVGLIVLSAQQFIAQGRSIWMQLAGASTTAMNLIDRVDPQIAAAVRGRIGSVWVELASHVGDAAQGLVTVLATLGLASLLSVFLLSSSPASFRHMLTPFMPSRRGAVEAATLSVLRILGAWFWAATVTGLVDAVVIGIGLAIMRVPLALSIAALTFVLAYVPLLGALIAGAVAVGVALSFKGPVIALAVVVLVLVVHQLEGNVLHPVLMSRAVEFPPYITLLIAATASTLLGIPGIFIAVPLVGAAWAGTRAYRESMTLPELPSAHEESQDDVDTPDGGGGRSFRRVTSDAALTAQPEKSRFGLQLHARRAK